MNKVVLISNGDFREAVGVTCWPRQEETLRQVEEALASFKVNSFRGNPYKPDRKHGFINTQAEACEIFSRLESDTPVIVVLSSWVWAHHLASSLKLHKGPVLLLANFDGTWPGLVALLNHSATYERMGIGHSRLWTDSFLKDQKFLDNLRTWLETGRIAYSTDHLTDLEELTVPAEARSAGVDASGDILSRKRILGQMDPGCMGMLNAVISPDKLAEIGMPVEYLNQSDLLSEMGLVTEAEAAAALTWLEEKGARFHWGSVEEMHLTRKQVITQMKMYLAAGRIHSRYGLAAIGIPYQYGLVRATAASDLPEGMLNNSDRPPIIDFETRSPVNPDRPIVHFNEGDIGSGVPQVLMHDLLTRKGMAPETTLHDVRWGIEHDGRFIWAFEISGGAPPAHFGGWHRTSVYRQTPMYFPKGGGTCSGVSRPGTITWARFYESFGEIGMDIGTGEVVSLPDEVLGRVRAATSEEWPIATVHIPGYGRDELMSTHRSNHITVCYGNIAAELAAAADGLGIPVKIAGEARELFT